MKPGTVDWADGASTAPTWFHCTGITPALGDNGAACAKEALEAAKAAGATVSMDLNFRKKLWSEKQAQSVMRPLMEYVDVVIANEEDIQSVLGFDVQGTDVTTGQAQSRGLQAGRRAHHQRRSTASSVAITLRESHLGERQRLERGDLRQGDRRLPAQPALRRAPGRSHRRRRQLRRRA